MGLAHNSVNDILSENPKSDKATKELLDRHELSDIATFSVFHALGVAIRKLDLLGWTQEEIGKGVDLTHQAVALILLENPKSDKLVKELLDRHGLSDIATVAKKSDLPELLVWAIALEGKSDVDRERITESALPRELSRG